MKLFPKIFTTACGLSGTIGVASYIFNNTGTSSVETYTKTAKEEYIDWITKKDCSAEGDEDCW